MFTAPQDTLSQTIPKGAGTATFEILSDANGPLPVPQYLRVPELLDYDYQDKRDVKTIAGAGARPIGLVGGKEDITISLTMAATFGKLLNQLCYGLQESASQHIFVIDEVGYVVPSEVTVDTKIRNCVMLHLGRWDSNNSVKINGTAADVVANPGSGQVSSANGKYGFNKADIGKQFEISFVSNGVTIVQTGRILAKLSHDVKLYSETKPVVKRDATTVASEKWNAKVAEVTDGKYQSSPNGVFLFHSNSNVPANKFMHFTHWTDGQICTSKIAEAQWPAAAYQFYVDPPSAAAYAAHIAVTLITNTGTAMTGVAVNADLTEGVTPTASGVYSQDDKGWYNFHATDVGDIVRISFQMDYYSIAPVCRNPRGEELDAVFYRGGGVFNAIGKPLTRVAIASPLSLGLDQYALDDKTGAVYLANENAGERIYIDAEFETTGGSRTEIKQTAVGLAPIVRIVLNNHEPDQQMLLTFERAMCEGMGVKTKMDDAAEAFKFSFKCAVDRVTGLSHAINTSS